MIKTIDITLSVYYHQTLNFSTASHLGPYRASLELRALRRSCRGASHRAKGLASRLLAAFNSNEGISWEELVRDRGRDSNGACTEGRSIGSSGARSQMRPTRSRPCPRTGHCFLSSLAEEILAPRKNDT